VSEAKSSSGVDSASEAESEFDDRSQNKSTKVVRQARKSVVPCTSGFNSEAEVGESPRSGRSARQAVKRPSRYSSGVDFENDAEESRALKSHKKIKRTSASQPTDASGEDSETETQHLVALKTRSPERPELQVLNNTSGLDTSG